MVEEIEVGIRDFVCDSLWPSSQHKCHWQHQDWVELFQVILPRLNKIHGAICSRDLSFIEPELLLSVFQRLEELRRLDQLSHQQLQLVFNAIAENRCNVKFLQLDHFGFKSSFSPQLFASAVSNVEEVICGSDVTHEQMEALFLTIAEGGRPMRMLELISCDTHDIEPGLFGAALNRLEGVTTANTWVRAKQVRAILELAVEDESELKMLMLGDMMMTEFYVDPQIKRLAKAKFGRFYYYCSEGFTTPDVDDLSIEDENNDDSEEEDVREECDADSINSGDFAEDDGGYNEEVMRLMKILYID